MGEISLGRYTDRTCDADTLKEMYRLRHAVFHDRMCWDVVSDHGMEHDFFDVLNPLYVLVRGGGHELVACWRLLPTTGAYMLRDVFPQLLHGQSAPQEQGIWELSRFAIAALDRQAPAFGFGETSIHMLQAVVRFALENSIRRYLTVTTVAIERIMRKFGLAVHRFGPPLAIGRTPAVALWFDVDSHTHAVAFGQDELRAAA